MILELMRYGYKKNPLYFGIFYDITEVIVTLPENIAMGKKI